MLKDLIGHCVQCVKVEDTAFNGNHPNGINTGYKKVGILKQLEPFVVITSFTTFFHTSLVKKIEDNLVYTENSVYRIVSDNND